MKTTDKRVPKNDYAMLYCWQCDEKVLQRILTPDTERKNLGEGWYHIKARCPHNHQDTHRIHKTQIMRRR